MRTQRRQLLAQLLRFGAAGLAALALDALLLYGLLACGLNLYLARALAFLAAVWLTWRLNRRFAFAAASAPAWQEWWRYLSAMALGGALNYGVSCAVLIYFSPARWLPLWAVCSGSLAGMLLNFCSAKWFVFKR